ncbi:hypothetical protein [Burkholderia lata]|uniref:hypothetical protein n=1 Tax=Burkholderia lata (strain ATCC 17760 / DSM 23089 / LMG 22485 / NCIMB 9086 / R18194 / 383) TaxID=482957 RepID=UPI001452D002|nr:hypothetical protein [Burkholderia lata]VWC44268.1 hypothetical protein BLA15816_07320 [Burkholderia lata]
MQKRSTTFNERAASAIHRATRKGTARFLAALAVAIPTAAQATYYAGIVTPTFTVVAIDSRTTSPDGSYISDQTCKIIRLSDTAVFFATGLTSAVGKYDLHKLAQVVYSSAASGAKLADVRDRWGEQAATTLRANLSPGVLLALQTTMKGGLLIGTFAGLDPDGSPATHTMKVALSADQQSFQKAPTDRSSGYFAAPGAHDLFSEFAPGSESDRAIRLMSNLYAKQPPSTQPPSLEYAEAIRAQAIVTAVELWSGNPEVGGDVSVAVIKRGGKWHWFHRPVHCAE